MEIQKWFENSGSYATGVALYSKLPGHSRPLLKSFSKENTANFLKLKYELKKALLSGVGTITPKKEDVVTVPEKTTQKEPLLELIVQQSVELSFEKETMAMYPMELHSVYRQRVNDFYSACELKFQLNAIPENEEQRAFQLMLQLEDLWTKIDRAWMILNHWKEHNRLMPVKESEDFSKLNGIQLLMKRDNLESSISKRRQTINRLEDLVVLSPEDRTLSTKLLRKLEELQQLVTDLETIRNLLLNERNATGAIGMAHGTETGQGPDTV